VSNANTNGPDFTTGLCSSNLPDNCSVTERDGASLVISTPLEAANCSFHQTIETDKFRTTVLEVLNTKVDTEMKKDETLNSCDNLETHQLALNSSQCVNQSSQESSERVGQREKTVHEQHLGHPVSVSSDDVIQLSHLKNSGLDISNAHVTALGYGTTSMLNPIDCKLNENFRNVNDQFSLTLGDIIASTVVNAVSNNYCQLEPEDKANVCETLTENFLDSKIGLLKTESAQARTFGSDFKRIKLDCKPESCPVLVKIPDLFDEGDLKVKTELKDEILRTNFDHLSNSFHSTGGIAGNLFKEDSDNIGTVPNEINQHATGPTSIVNGPAVDFKDVKDSDEAVSATLVATVGQNLDQSNACSDKKSVAIRASPTSFRSIDALLQTDNKLIPSSPPLMASDCSLAPVRVPSVDNGVISEEDVCTKARWNLNSAVQQGVWFSVLPSSSCDFVNVQSTSTDLVKTCCAVNSIPCMTSVALSGQFSLYDQLLAVASGQPSGLMSSVEGTPTVAGTLTTTSHGSMTMLLPNNSGVGRIKLRGDEVLTLEMEMNQSEFCQLPFAAEPIPIGEIIHIIILQKSMNYSI